MKNNDKQTTRMVVAGTNANGEPDLFFCRVICRQEQYDTGDHYDAAADTALLNGYGSPFVIFDEHDPPKSLFNLFDWDTASDHDISEEAKL